MSCVIDNDFGQQPDCFTVKDRKARKEHKCYECERTIQVGETYRYESGVWEEQGRSFKTCNDCLSVRSGFFCAWSYGEVWEDIKRFIYDNWFISEDNIIKLTPMAKARVLQILDKCFEDN